MALSADRRTPKRGQNVLADYLDVPVAASAILYNGALVALNLSGYAVPADATTAGLRVIGVASAKADNTGGSAGAIKVRVERGVFGMKNSATVQALSAADVGRPCFAVDDCTVARTPSMGARPYCGRVYEIGDDGLVYVEIDGQGDTSDTNDVFVLAGADLSSTGQHLFVELGSGGTVTVCNAAGEDALGVCQNAPASGAMAIVRTRGRSVVIASASVTTGAKIATTNAGKSKTAVAATCDSSGASATAAISGSHVMGRAMTDGATDTAHYVYLHPMGFCGATSA